MSPTRTLGRLSILPAQSHSTSAVAATTAQNRGTWPSGSRTSGILMLFLTKARRQWTVISACRTSSSTASTEATPTYALIVLASRIQPQQKATARATVCWAPHAPSTFRPSEKPCPSLTVNARSSPLGKAAATKSSRRVRFYIFFH